MQTIQRQKERFLNPLGWCLLSVLACAVLCISTPADAATYNVTNTDDSGSGSLRQAITDANADAGADIIDCSGASGIINLASNLPAITEDVNIQGPGANVLTVDGGGSRSCIVHLSSTADVTSSISGLKIENCSTSNGGGVTNWGPPSGEYKATLTIYACEIVSNTASNDGGGIFNGNDNAELIISYSTISNNTADRNGGGISNRDAGTLTMTNCTVSGNEADLGGGVFNGSGTVSLTNCTVAANSAAQQVTAGIDSMGGTFNIRNVIFADNQVWTSLFPMDNDCMGVFNSLDYNLIEKMAMGGSIGGTTTNNIGPNTGSDPNLSALADNGGPTRTMALASDSPAKDTIPQTAGGNTYNGCPNIDQRIYSRPTGSGTSNNRDMGAYEFGATLLVELFSFTAKGLEDFARLEWETASEIDTAGFHLWRSHTANGAYSRITDFLIPAEGGSTRGAVYEYEDFDVEPGLTYYYQLEDIDYDGVSAFHGPVSAMLGDENIALIYPESSDCYPDLLRTY